MNRNLNRRIHPIAEADGLSPKKPRKYWIYSHAYKPYSGKEDFHHLIFSLILSFSFSF